MKMFFKKSKMILSNPGTQFSAMGLLTCLFGLIMVVLILTLMAYNLKHWKQVALKINIIQRRCYLKNRKELMKKLKNK